MTDKERLVEVFKSAGKKYDYYDCTEEEALELLAQHLLDSGVIVPPYEIGAKVYATIGSLSLPIPYAVYEVTIQRYVLVKGGLVPVVKLKKGAVTYGDIHTSIDRMYDTREEAEKALKGGEQG